MWLSLFLLAMLVAVAYLQLIQGLVSAMIACVLAILCAVFAFATYEWVAIEVLMGPLGDLALPAAFIGTFVTPLIVLRLVLDHYVGRSNLIPALIDRVLGTGCAIVAAFVVTGMLGITIRMTPFGNSFLGFQSLDVESGEVNSLWMGPDQFAVHMASFLSDGMFGGNRPFSEDHPDFIEEISWSQSAHYDTRHLVPPESIRFVRIERGQGELPYIFRKKKKRGESPDRVNPADGHEYLLVRIALLSEAKDEDDKHRFARRQIRLVGTDNESGPNVNKSPVAIQDDEDPQQSPYTIVDEKLYAPYNDGEVSVVFEVPESFVPEFVEYKIGARVKIPKTSGQGSGDAPPAPKSTPSTTASSLSSGFLSSKPSSPNNSGRVSGVRLGSQGHRFSNEIPMALTSYQATGADGRGSDLSTGHVYGKVADQSSGSSRRISTFTIPSDKRMFQLDVRKLQAGSTLGKALQFAVTSVKNYTLTDEQGNRIPVYGQFVVADVDGEQVIEVQYYPEAVSGSNRGGIRDFRLVKKRHFDRGDYQLVYLFLVDPGVKLTKFSTGRKSMDLSFLNLVAPN